MKFIATSPKAQFLCTQGFLEFTQGHLDPMEALAMVAANQTVILRQEKNMMIYAEKSILYIFWLVVEPTHLNNMKVSWDDFFPLNGKIKNVPNHQPVFA